MRFVDEEGEKSEILRQEVRARVKRFCINCGHLMPMSKRHTKFVCDKCGVHFRVMFIGKKRGRK
jgi:predicted RNA-binding Zn-ribbon protein involved in translation (DUF1610 family)